MTYLEILLRNMELSERWIKKFEDEGFASIYEHQDIAGTERGKSQ
jgi:hypothetical protein